MNNNIFLIILLSFTIFFTACDSDGKIDGNANIPIFTSPSEVSVNENQNSAITLIATDKTGAVSYSISGEDSSYFGVNEVSGIVLFINPPDYEIKTTYTFTAKATNSEKSYSTQSVTVTIIDIDETIPDTIAPVFTSPSSVTVDEAQSLAITLQATDNISVVSYAIDDGDSAEFALNEKSGEVVFINLPDYETKTSYTFNAIASDYAGNETTQSVVINIADVDESAPIFSSSPNADVFENQLSAITLIATDNQSAVLYSIDNGDSALFNVNAATGVVLFNDKPDYEEKTSYTFIAKASDAVGNETTQDIYIYILDIDESSPDTEAPIFTSDSNATAYEDQTSAITLVASDNISAVIYTISQGDSASFIVDATSGVVVFTSAPDYDVQTLYTFTAKATDSSLNESTQDVSITILEVDYDAPVFTSPSAVSVNEDQTSAITLVATDNISSVAYSILNGDDSASFNVDSSSGLVTFKSAPSYETQTSYSFTAVASDTTGNLTTQAVSITILYVDETLPVFSSPTNASVFENQTSAITLVATDDNGAVSYSISGGDSSSFAVDDTSGVVTFLSAPDYEAKSTYTFESKATDSVGNATTQNIIITIKNIDENPPAITSPLLEQVYENQTSATTIVATDETSPITYSISGGDSISFNVNSSSGLVTFKVAPDYETKDSYIFTSIATDPLAQQSSQSTTIEILDVNEVVQGAFVKKTGQTNSYDENGDAVLDNSLKDDGFYRKGTDSDYIRDNTLNIVTDNLTNLMWQDDVNASSMTLPWILQTHYDSGDYNNTDANATHSTATSFCEDLTIGIYSDWRLPSIQELVDLTDYNEYSPAINTTFINTYSGVSNYWSSNTSTSTSDDTYAWSLYIYRGEMHLMNKLTNFYVRCVREKI